MNILVLVLSFTLKAWSYYTLYKVNFKARRLSSVTTNSNSKDHNVKLRKKVELRMGLKSFIKNRLNNENNEYEKRKLEIEASKQRQDTWIAKSDSVYNTLEYTQEKSKKNKKNSEEKQLDSSNQSFTSSFLNNLKSPIFEKQQSSSPSTITHGRNEEKDEESIQQRISRHKSGGMTEDEKKAFVQTALTRSTSISRLEYDANVAKRTNNTPVIRQQVPSVTSPPKAAAPPAAKSQQNSPSPFPSDALWNTIVGRDGGAGNKLIRYEDIMQEEDKDEAKKREYYNMITNPDRFKSFSTFKGNLAGNTPIPPPPAPSPILREEMSQPKKLDNYMKESELESELESQPEQTSSPSNQTTFHTPIVTPDMTLSDRLEQAAILQVKLDAEKREKAERLRLEQKRRMELEQQQINALRKQREEATLEKERQIRARRLEHQEELKKRELERQRQHEEQIRLLQQRQDEYWNNKLKNEKKPINTPQQQQQEKLLDDYKQQLNEKKVVIPTNDPITSTHSTSIPINTLPKNKPSAFEPTKPSIPINSVPSTSIPTNSVTTTTDTQSNSIGESKISQERAKELARKSLQASAAKVLEQRKQEAVVDWSKLKSGGPSVAPSNTTATPTKRLSLREMTRFKKDEGDSSKEANVLLNQKTIGDVMHNYKEEGEEEDSKPIRMRVFDGADDNDEDDETSANDTKVPDDAKQRANRWGINLDLLKGDS